MPNTVGKVNNICLLIHFYEHMVASITLDQLGPDRGSCTTLTLSAPASLSVCKFSLYYPRKRSCLVMRIKRMVIYRNISKMKNKILPTSLRGNFRDSLGEFSNVSYGMFGAERVKAKVTGIFIK